MYVSPGYIASLMENNSSSPLPQATTESDSATAPAKTANRGFLARFFIIVLLCKHVSMQGSVHIILWHLEPLVKGPTRPMSSDGTNPLVVRGRLQAENVVGQDSICV